jgi:hypothetical protein
MANMNMLMLCAGILPVLKHEGLSHPCHRADEHLLDILTNYGDEFLRKRSRKDDLKLDFEGLVVRLLPSGNLTADMIAMELAMSNRTLAPDA